MRYDIDFNSLHSAACFVLSENDNPDFQQFESYEEVYDFVRVMITEIVNKDKHPTTVESAGLFLSFTALGDDSYLVYCFVDPRRRYDPKHPDSVVYQVYN